MGFSKHLFELFEPLAVQGSFRRTTEVSVQILFHLLKDCPVEAFSTCDENEIQRPGEKRLLLLLYRW